MQGKRKNDNNGNTVYLLGHNARAKTSLRQAQSIFMLVNINSIVLFSCEVPKCRIWIFLQSHQYVIVSHHTIKFKRKGGSISEAAWTAAVGTGLAVVFFQPLQLAAVVLGCSWFRHPTTFCWKPADLFWLLHLIQWFHWFSGEWSSMCINKLLNQWLFIPLILFFFLRPVNLCT